MDCTSARLLLSFVRTGELDAAEREALDGHLRGCAECTAALQAESCLDDALATAMQRVPVPRDLQGRVLEQLARQRRPRRWTWAAAATLLLAAGTGAYLALTAGPEVLDSAEFVTMIDEKALLSAETVEARFDKLGIAMKPPRDFNFSLLENYDVAMIQRRNVAKLTFAARGVAHVYVLPVRYFKLPPEHEEAAARKEGWLSEVIPASTHNIRIRRDPNIPDFFFVVVYTSATLEPFLFQGI